LMPERPLGSNSPERLVGSSKEPKAEDPIITHVRDHPGQP
jgi:hypothetical protein